MQKQKKKLVLWFSVAFLCLLGFVALFIFYSKQNEEKPVLPTVNTLNKDVILRDLIELKPNPTVDKKTQKLIKSSLLYSAKKGVSVTPERRKEIVDALLWVDPSLDRNVQ